MGVSSTPTAPTHTALSSFAHRLSTIRNAHCIYVMEDNQLAEADTHEKLLDRQGIYASLWQVQMGQRDRLA